MRFAASGGISYTRGSPLCFKVSLVRDAQPGGNGPAD
jgi:hypothetical protein